MTMIYLLPGPPAQEQAQRLQLQPIEDEWLDLRLDRLLWWSNRVSRLHGLGRNSRQILDE